MKRRAFLSLLGLGAAGLAVDPEALRQPARTYFLPPPTGEWVQSAHACCQWKPFTQADYERCLSEAATNLADEIDRGAVRRVRELIARGELA